MNFAAARQTVAKLFGPGLKLHRGKNKCFLLRDGLVLADGLSWLECLRSYGEVCMLQNARRDAEHLKTAAMIEQFKKEHPTLDPEKLTEEQLLAFDSWVTEYEKPKAPACTNPFPFDSRR